MRKTILVIAGNLQQYKQWQRENPEIAPNARYACYPSHLLGFSPENVDLIYYGEHWLNPLSDSTELEIRGFPSYWQRTT